MFAENLDPTVSNPPGFSNWGEWMIDTAGLDRGRWGAGGGGLFYDNQLPDGIQPFGNVVSTAGGHKTGACGKVIWIENGNLFFNPANIPGTTAGTNNGGTFCKSLKDSYPSNSNRIIPLATTGAVKF